MRTLKISIILDIQIQIVYVDTVPVGTAQTQLPVQNLHPTRRHSYHRIPQPTRYLYNNTNPHPRTPTRALVTKII